MPAQLVRESKIPADNGEREHPSAREIGLLEIIIHRAFRDRGTRSDNNASITISALRSGGRASVISQISIIEISIRLSTRMRRRDDPIFTPPPAFSSPAISSLINSLAVVNCRSTKRNETKRNEAQEGTKKRRRLEISRLAYRLLARRRANARKERG